MRLIRKIFRICLILIPLAAAALALTLSHDSPCVPAPALVGETTTMQAIAYRCYGPPDVVHLERVAKPVPKDDELLVRVRAAGVNPLDWHYVHGTPYIMRLEAGLGAPTVPRLGVDFAGTVEAVGKDVTRFHPGDEVFGGRNGAYAEYLTVRESRAVVLKPANMSFEQAASVPVAAVTALQALRDKGGIQAGQKVLINGASGGVGTFAVQIAKSFGAEVTGVCSTKNVEMVRSLGADHVIDYSVEDFTQGQQRYDLIVDMVSTHSLLDYKRVLNPHGNFVIVGGAGGPDDKWLGPLASPIYAMFLSPFVSQKFGMMLAELNQPDLIVLSEMMKAGTLQPVIDRTYPLSELPEALRYLEQGHARGKVVIAVGSATPTQP